MFSIIPYDHVEAKPKVGSTHVGDANQDMILAKIKALAVKNKGDDSPASLHLLFNDYAGDKGCLDKADITRLLNDAGVNISAASFLGGNKYVAGKVLEALNTSKSGCLTWEEYASAAGVVETKEPTLLPPADKPPVDAPPPAPSGYMRSSASVMSEWIRSNLDMTTQIKQLTPEEETARRKAIADEKIKREQGTKTNVKSGTAPELKKEETPYLMYGLLLAIPVGAFLVFRKR
jgi:hypothetical protein